jgi:dolichyl-phosphate beta-glucosyltransferase
MGDGRPEVELSVVIPAYNEADRIGLTLTRTLLYLDDQSYDWEILVVVDGGRDGTAGVVRDVAQGRPNVAVLENEVNRGKGFSVRRGMLASRGRFVLFTDADLSTPMQEAGRLLAWLRNGYDVAIASRELPASELWVRQPLWRQSMGRLYNWCARRAGLTLFKDTQCGFKCFRGEVARRLFRLQRVDRFGFDVEVLWIACKLGYLIAEVPVVWIDSPSSRVHPVRDSVSMLLDLLRVRLNDRRGVYGEAAGRPRPGAAPPSTLRER